MNSCGGQIIFVCFSIGILDYAPSVIYSKTALMRSAQDDRFEMVSCCSGIFTWPVSNN